MSHEDDGLRERLKSAEAEGDRLRAALVEASEALDAAGSQVAASDAHRAARSRVANDWLRPANGAAVVVLSREQAEIVESVMARGLFMGGAALDALAAIRVGLRALTESEG